MSVRFFIINLPWGLVRRLINYGRWESKESVEGITELPNNFRGYHKISGVANEGDQISNEIALTLNPICNS